jgi:Tfp pilus assembly protein PilV
MKIRSQGHPNQAILHLCSDPAPGYGRAGAHDAENGFTLLENLLALAVLTFGLLAAGQLIAAALKSATLAQAKACAILAAQSKAEYLVDRYQHDSSAPDVQTGRHGPEIQEVVDPVGQTVLSRLEISWTIASMPDPRTDAHLAARLLTVEVKPIDQAGAPNSKIWLNRELSLSTVLSPWEVP